MGRGHGPSALVTDSPKDCVTLVLILLWDLSWALALGGIPLLLSSKDEPVAPTNPPGQARWVTHLRSSSSLQVAVIAGPCCVVCVEGCG